MAPSFDYKGVTYLHTESPWQSRTNRHTTTVGCSWGWIDGPRTSADICWSDDPGSRFTGKDANEVIRIHNEWLKEQEPVEIQLVKAHRQLAYAEGNYRHAEEKLRQVSEELDDSRKLVAALESKQSEHATT